MIHWKQPIQFFEYGLKYNPSPELLYGDKNSPFPDLYGVKYNPLPTLIGDVMPLDLAFFISFRALIMLATELPIDPIALSPVKIGNSGSIPPDFGSLIIRFGIVMEPLREFFTDFSAELIASFSVFGFDSLMAALAFFINEAKETRPVFRLAAIFFFFFLFIFLLQIPEPNLLKLVFAFIAAETANAAARSPKLESEARARFKAADVNFLSALYLSKSSVYSSYAISCSLHASSSPLIPVSPRAKRSDNLVPIRIMTTIN